MMLCHPEFPSRKDLLPFHAMCHQHRAFPCQLLQRLLQLYITSPEVMPCPGKPSSTEQARQGIKTQSFWPNEATGQVQQGTSVLEPPSSFLLVLYCSVEFPCAHSHFSPPYIPRYWSLTNTCLPKLHLTVHSRRTQL